MSSIHDEEELEAETYDAVYRDNEEENSSTTEKDSSSEEENLSDEREGSSSEKESSSDEEETDWHVETEKKLIEAWGTKCSCGTVIL